MTTKSDIDRAHYFSEYFGTGSGIQFAKSQALAGTLQHSPLRSLCWRVCFFMNVNLFMVNIKLYIITL